MIFDFLINPTVRAVCESLKNSPEEWKMGTCEVVHKTGVVVWHRNRSYGLDIKHGGGVVWGGVGLVSSFGLSLSHHVLNHAIKRFERGNPGSVISLLSPTGENA